jgi:hypothetical protein
MEQEKDEGIRAELLVAVNEASLLLDVIKYSLLVNCDDSTRLMFSWTCKYFNKYMATYPGTFDPLEAAVAGARRGSKNLVKAPLIYSFDFLICFEECFHGLEIIIFQ